MSARRVSPHTPWITLARLFIPAVFHSCVCVIVFSVFTMVICEMPVDEEYILKAHKVIEAVPRALNRHASDPYATALLADGKSSEPCSDRLSYEAIKTLHRQLDDDASGDIDVAESDEFLRDELQYENGYERHKEFHGDDKSISVDELWDAWKVSHVHNWTVDETIEWLVSYVELPNYEHSFRNSAVDGTCLPRLAINSNSFLSGRLGIKDPIHRQKIALKAMDVVLFGPPRRHNYLKDAILAISLVVATGGCWFAFVQHKYSQTHMLKMMKDMEVLQKAEEALIDMQHELNKARHEQEIVNIEKQDLERRLQDEMKTSGKNHGRAFGGSSDQLRLRELEEQLRTARSSLHDAERRLGARSWVAPPTLQNWLQLTHELELRNYNKKKSIAEQQLQAAKEGCEKLRRKRSTFMGAFRITHGGSIDDIDDRIIQAKAALSEVTSDLQERMHRWKQIERLCGVPIMQNPGISYLEAILKPPVMNGNAGTLHSGVISLARRSSSEGNLSREESPPPYAAGANAVPKSYESRVDKRHYLDHQDSGISLTSNITLPSSCCSLKNALLANIPPPPPPKYSRSSPSYMRKPTSVNSSEGVQASYYSTSSVSGYPGAHCPSGSFHDILEAEDDDQLLEPEEEAPGGTATPHSSYSGYSDAGRPVLLLEETLNETFSGGCAGASCPAERGSSDQLLQEEADEPSSHSESAKSDSQAASENGEACHARKISSSGEVRKKKLSSVIVNSLKNSFSSSNLSTSEACDDPTEVKEKKKNFFPRLMRKKPKMM